MKWAIGIGAFMAAGLAIAPLTARQDVALKDLMPKGTVIGVAINQRQSDGVDTAAVGIITKQFNQISPENLLKFQPVHPAADRYAFEAQDRYVQFGVDRKMQVIGHTLVWHQQTPAWVFQGADGTPADRETLLARMRDHIHTVVGRYKGKIHGWDVVNEAIDDAQPGLRSTVFSRGLGPGYVAEAFRLARQADPDAQLVYNDYGGEGLNRKSNDVYELVRELKQRGLVDGVGLQMHVSATSLPPVADIAANIRRLAALGLQVNISEMDVRVRDVPGDAAAKLARQRQVYRDVVAACVAEPRCEAVTFWGFTDAHSWIDGSFGLDDVRAA
jgi:endo-1,4-beta-xylanase